MGHLRINLHAKVLHIWILVPLEHTDTMGDGLKTLLWSSDSKLDHRGGLISVSEKSENLEGTSYLIGTQLEVVSLIGDQVAKFHGEHTSLVSDNQGKIPILEINFVSTLKVIVDGDFLLGVGLAIPILEDSVLGMSTLIGILRTTLPGEALNGVSLDICKNLSATIA